MSRAMSAIPAPLPLEADQYPVRRSAPESGTAPLRDTATRTRHGGNLALGFGGSVLLSAGALGAGATVMQDPLLTGTVFGALRYGHGKNLATAAVYLGVGMLVLAWVRLGR